MSQLQLQIEKSKTDNILLLNEVLDYVQPFKTPLLIYGKFDDKNILKIACYSFGSQKNIFYGHYNILNDKLIIENICYYKNIRTINKFLEMKKIDGYILLADCAKNKMTCEHEYQIYRAYKDKKSFSYLTYNMLDNYIELIINRLNNITDRTDETDKPIKTDKMIDEAITLFCKIYIFSISLYFWYHNGSMSPKNPIYKELDNIVIITDVEKKEYIKLIDELWSTISQGLDYIIIDDVKIDIYLYICLNISMSTYKDVNLINIIDKKNTDITYKIINHLSHRSFINQHNKTLCPEYEYCVDNYMDNELCNIYTNFML